MRGLLPHPDRRDHSFAGAARKRFSHDHAVWSRYAVFVIREKQRNDAETSGEKISRKHESMVGRTSGRLSRGRARRESMHRKKEQVGKWGVETEWENVFLCGSSALRGGAVSGIPGHNAAKKVLEIIGGSAAPPGEVGSTRPEAAFY